MATLLLKAVAKEIERPRLLWANGGPNGDGLERWLSPDALAELDPFGRIQLAYVVDTCATCRLLSQTGRKLCAASRAHRAGIGGCAGKSLGRTKHPTTPTHRANPPR
jgi:sigma54-dependent transcription regulator